MTSIWGIKRSLGRSWNLNLKKVFYFYGWYHGKSSPCFTTNKSTSSGAVSSRSRPTFTCAGWEIHARDQERREACQRPRSFKCYLALKKGLMRICEKAPGILYLNPGIQSLIWFCSILSDSSDRTCGHMFFFAVL